jgi:hypothetical protein
MFNKIEIYINDKENAIIGGMQMSMAQKIIGSGVLCFVICLRGLRSKLFSFRRFAYLENLRVLKK